MNLKKIKKILKEFTKNIYQVYIFDLKLIMPFQLLTNQPQHILTLILNFVNISILQVEGIMLVK